MSNFSFNAYRGPPGVPHVREDVFKITFLAAHASFWLLTLSNGRVLGSEFAPRRYNRDLIIRAVDANGRHREGLRGKKPRHFFHKPSDSDHSFEKKWWSELHWKRWTQERMGGGHIRLE
ncbi:hypothetical protein WJX84_006931 [Apatococcus fuscideae]|uniref:Uncharacterized protein n=1 Tax=Apatococcus fuscideae TaxID=2026836 RepID=A0AAW1SJG7_9CHLO